MKLKQLKMVFVFVLIFSFQGCVSTNSIKSIAQTNSASQIEEYIDSILKDLVLYKEKLDLRNPNAFNKAISLDIKEEILKKQDYINIVQDGKKLSTYNQYLHYAFSKNDVKNRNDFLILGIYKLIHQSLLLYENHQFTAMQYNKHDILRLYEYLQIVRWKIKTNKDENGNYLFNTWQNNWQLELERKDLTDLNIIKELEYIKTNKETIFDHSNFSFENLISVMLRDVEHILKKINIEPYEMSFSAIKSFVFIL